MVNWEFKNLNVVLKALSYCMTNNENLKFLGKVCCTTWNRTCTQRHVEFYLFILSPLHTHFLSLSESLLHKTIWVHTWVHEFNNPNLHLVFHSWSPSANACYQLNVWKYQRIYPIITYTGSTIDGYSASAKANIIINDATWKVWDVDSDSPPRDTVHTATPSNHIWPSQPLKANWRHPWI